MSLDELWGTLFDFTDYGALLSLLANTVIAGAVLGVLGGVIGYFVMARDLPFAVHGISELSFAGASAALLLGINVVVGSIAGSLLAAVIIGLLGTRARDRNSIIGVLMPFGLGLGILFLTLHPGRSSNKFGLLTGQIVAVDDPQLGTLIVVAAIVLAGLAVLWRPLLFASLDEDVAAARGLPVGALSIAFMVLLALATAVSLHIVGALLVLALLVTPAAAAMRVATAPATVVALSVLFATVSTVGGILLALGSSIPISPYITTISFLIYLLCRVLSAARGRAAAQAPRLHLSR